VNEVERIRSEGTEEEKKRITTKLRELMKKHKMEIPA
jgi:hypothetical protein